MNQQKYKVVFNGRVVSGKTIETVKEKIISIFKIDRTKADLLFSGQPRVILKNSSLEKCEKVQKRLRRLGAICTIQPEYASDYAIPLKSSETESTEQKVAPAVEPPAKPAVQPASQSTTREAQKDIDISAILKNKYALACGAAVLLLVVVILFILIG